ncbi:hypothetical protein [Chitinophaga nivalis]|uniref:Uncharacterized protein n=1 Tax=Chitinophaga nivalis TaxID=2991709 RepID=A0ABT3IKU4_9BACT|nr:hypothetical protein [Chitinophaga nivalis]MCW3465734.1 hypothetical protein [Chitinophaga nivalis]MCW3484575.1 hypothetical protein [Chitinophaga nivalis]
MRYHFRSALLLINVLLFGACQKEQADNQSAAATQTASTARSAHQDKVLTPGGWRSRSDVHLLAQGQYLDASDGRLRTRDHASRQVISDYGPVEKASGHAPFFPLQAKASSSGDGGWVTCTRWGNRTGSPISYFSTKWVVPPAPKDVNGQTVFIFNGMVNSSAILQPVLQWGVSAAGGGDYWAIATWYVGASGLAWYSDLVRVKPGTTLQGLITIADSLSGSYSYRASFPGYSKTIFDTHHIEQLKWATEALEAYSTYTCATYPATTKTRMSNIDVKTGSIQAPLSWEIVDYITDCGQHSKVVTDGSSNGIVDLFYKK